MTPAASVFIEPATAGLDFAPLVQSYRKYLQSYGVEWPGPSQEPGLWFLHKHIGKPISQDQLTRFYSQALGLSYNKQLRHLAGRGWHIASGNVRSVNMPVLKQLKRDELMLVSVQAPNPIWSNQKQTAVSVDSRALSVPPLRDEVLLATQRLAFPFPF